VAFEPTTQSLFCNDCIFNLDWARDLSKLNFTSLIAGRLKDKLDVKFEMYKEALKQMDTIEPDVIRLKIESTLEEFFTSVHNEIDVV